MDLLRAAGLRENDLTGTGADLIPGPTGELDAFFLSRALEVNASDVLFNVIGANLPSSFALFTVLNLDQYIGPILSVGESFSEVPALQISLDNTAFLTQTLINVSLPGLDPVRISVPSSVMGNTFQRLGVQLKGSQLVVTINCTISSVTNLRSPPDLLLLDDGVLSLFDSGVMVRY